jgi:hypothetical protein
MRLELLQQIAQGMLSGAMNDCIFCICFCNYLNFMLMNFEYSACEVLCTKSVLVLSPERAPKKSQSETILFSVTKFLQHLQEVLFLTVINPIYKAQDRLPWRVLPIV